MSDTVTASDWVKGIALSVLASIIGASSKLAIRKSWLLMHQHQHHHRQNLQQAQVQEQTHRNGIDVSSENRNSATDESHLTATIATTSAELQIGEGDDGHSGTIDSTGEGEEEGFSYQMMGRTDSFSEEATRSHFSDEREPHQQQQQQQQQEQGNQGVRMIAWCLRGYGFVGMTFLNPAACVGAMNFASPSILAPFSGLTLVWIVFCSQPLIGESPSTRQIFAACLIIAGQICVAVFGDHTNQPNMTIEKMTQSYKQPPFLLYMMGTVAWVFLLVWWIRNAKSTTLQRLGWGCAGGSMTGMQNFLKDFLTILQVRKVHESYPWYTIPFAILAILTAFGGLLFLTWCMKRFDVTYCAASFVGSFVINASIMSAVHYHTFQNLSGIIDSILYPFGLFVLLCGVWVLVTEKYATNDVGAHLHLDSGRIHIRSSSRLGSRVEMVSHMVVLLFLFGNFVLLFFV
jgi:hypothetical protein